jgi:hypothetical protein
VSIPKHNAGCREANVNWSEWLPWLELTAYALQGLVFGLLVLSRPLLFLLRGWRAWRSRNREDT